MNSVDIIMYVSMQLLVYLIVQHSALREGPNVDPALCCALCSDTPAHRAWVRLTVATLNGSTGNCASVGLVQE